MPKMMFYLFEDIFCLSSHLLLALSPSVSLSLSLTLSLSATQLLLQIFN